MLQEHTGRDITVKGRQTRASSLILARNLRRMTTSFGLKCLVATHTDATTMLFRARIKHHLQDLARAGLDYEIVSDNKDEIVIGRDMECRYIFASGEQRVSGRSFSAQIVHLSEVAFWRPDLAGELIGGITPSVPGPPIGWFDMESTPNGGEGIFYEYAQDALNEDPLQGWALHFYPWWLEPRYKSGLEEDCDFRLDSETFDQLVREFEPAHRERYLMEEHGLSVGQIIWRRWRERELHRTGVPFLQEMVEDFGSCWITGSENYFASPDGTDHLAWYRTQCSDPFERISSLPYHSHEASFFGANLAIWERPDPRSTYAAFCDLAEGGTGRDHDFSALTVVNVMTRHHVATLRVKCAPGDFALMACAVGQFYNMATIGGERGNYGSACLDRIRELSYSRIYYHVDQGKKPEPWIFPTQQHRDDMLRILHEGIFDHSLLTRDKVAVSEMGTFDWQKVSTNRNRVARARKRRNDDLVISLAGSFSIARRIYRAPNPDDPRDRPEEIVVGPHGVVLSRGRQSAKPWFR